MTAELHHGTATLLKTVRLRDGNALVLRMPTESDAVRLLNLVQLFSARAISSIPLESILSGSRTLVERYTTTNNPDRFTVVADLSSGAEGKTVAVAAVVGVAHYWRVGPQTANMTIVVGDAWQGRGIGTALMLELAKVARDNGIQRFDTFFRADNIPMQALLHKCGFEVRKLPSQEGAWEILT